MIDIFKRIAIIGDDLWNNETHIENIINIISHKSIILLEESTDDKNLSKFVRKHAFIKGIETIGYQSNLKNLQKSQIIIKESKPDLVILFIPPNSNSNYDNIENICSIYKTPILKTTDIEKIEFEYICGRCGKKSIKKLNYDFGKFCSPECIIQNCEDIQEDSPQEHPPTPYKNKNETSLTKSSSFQKIEDINNDEFQTKCCKTFINKKNGDKSFINNEKIDKFQMMMKIEAKRHIYLTRKEEYKKQMSRKSSKVPKRDKKNILKIILCQAITKKSKKPCSNNSLPGSNYCGIASHKKLNYIKKSS